MSFHLDSLFRGSYSRECSPWQDLSRCFRKARIECPVKMVPVHSPVRKSAVFVASWRRKRKIVLSSYFFSPTRKHHFKTIRRKPELYDSFFIRLVFMCPIFYRIVPVREKSPDQRPYILTVIRAAVHNCLNHPIDLSTSTTPSMFLSFPINERS